MAVEVDGMGGGDECFVSDVREWFAAGDDEVDVAVCVVLGHDGVFGGQCAGVAEV